MRVAKAVAGTIGSALVGLVITFAAIPEWTLMNLELHFWQTVGGFIISAAFGGAVVFIVYATYMGWKLGSKPCKAFDDLRGIDGLGECESLADMVEPVRGFAAKADDLKRQLAAKDEKITELTKTFDERVSTEVKKQVVEFINEFDEHLRIMNDPDSVIRDRIDARELDGHSAYILNLVLKTRVDERRWLREALSDGVVTVRDDELQMFDEGWYFRDLVEEEARCTDSYGKPARRYRLKPDVADVLSANPEVFRIVEQHDETWREIARDHNERVARGKMKSRP